LPEIEDGLYSYLSGVSALIALTSTRIYPAQAPINATKPYMVTTRTGGAPVHNLGADSGYRSTRFQFDIWAASALSARNVARELQTALQDRTATLGSVNIDRVIGPEIETEGYDYETNSLHHIE
jgi:hypothetical protein